MQAFLSMRKHASRPRLHGLATIVTVVCAVVAGVAFGAVPAQAAAKWTPLGGQLNTATSCCVQVSMRVDFGGHPYVAYVEASGTNSWLRVDTWRGGAWTHLGSALNTAAPSLSTSSLALDAAGNPVVAWVEGGQGYVSRWDGTSWKRVGTPFAGAHDGYYMTIVSTNPLRASYYNLGPSSTLVLMEWNGTAWTQLATGTGTGGYILSRPDSIVVDGAGNIDVAWQALRPTGSIWDWDLVVEQFAAGTWSRIGGLLNVNPPPWGVGGAQLRVSGTRLTVLFTESFYRQPAQNYASSGRAAAGCNSVASSAATPPLGCPWPSTATGPRRLP